MSRSYRPFAITARSLGAPPLLYTPLLVVNLQAEGDRLRAAKVNALWDTGAQVCVMTRALADSLGFRYTHTMASQGIGGDVTSPLGVAYVSLASDGQVVDTLAAVVDSLPGDGRYSFIIGMDFIRKGALAISSTGMETALSFRIPAVRNVDFTSDADLRAVRRLPLSSTTEDGRLYRGHEVLSLLSD